MALASFPGSGNTWLRYLLQQATGKMMFVLVLVLHGEGGAKEGQTNVYNFANWISLLIISFYALPVHSRYPHRQRVHGHGTCEEWLSC